MFHVPEIEETRGEVELAAQARRLHQHYTVRQAGASSLGRRRKAQRFTTAPSQRYQRLRSMSSLWAKVQSVRRRASHSQMRAHVA